MTPFRITVVLIVVLLGSRGSCDAMAATPAGLRNGQRFGDSPSSPGPHLAAPPIATTTEGWWLGKPRPYFADSPTNHTVISGQSAYLPCRVHMLGDRSVTWMRGRDLHILTVGLVTYSADERFQVLHSSETDDWTLHVQYSQPRDSGTYKCQVNSDPKIARNVYLSVTDKRYLDGNLYKMPATNSERGGYGTHILGGNERFLQAGSSLSLECVVTHTAAPPTAVLWYHDNTVLDYDSPRGGINIQVEKSGDQTTSRLLLSAVRETDSGNYTCVPVNAPIASVSVHVNNDELRAAVHQGGLSSASVSHPLSGVLMVILNPCLVMWFLGSVLFHRNGEYNVCLLS